MNLPRLRVPSGIAAFAALSALLLPAAAADFAPAIVYDFGGKFDRSFNQSASEGAERFKKETGIAFREFEITNAAQREQVMTQFARRGATIIVAVGFTQASAVERVAREFPEVKFTIIDGTVDLPNVQSVNFREQESSFLCGMLAALASKTGKVGFVGGMDIPLIRKFALGYRAGAQYVNPAIEVFENMTGTTPGAWGDPTKGAELARSQFGRGADVIFHAAGATGLGVMQAAQDEGRLSIGCDSNQDYLHPGSVLTSAVKRVDVAVYRAFRDARNGTWKAGPLLLGLAENGVDWALDEHNRALVTPEMERRVNQARADIISGKVKVPEYKAP
ncbi:MAG TPA: BMP family ABC transporter substrate-binding protein [Opitutaceae bacterium]|nr:BMP family ABC transporter substrate-binding protein [Opitutaceae bacterium]